MISLKKWCGVDLKLRLLVMIIFPVVVKIRMTRGKSFRPKRRKGRELGKAFKK